jgi:hypothetical protein
LNAVMGEELAQGLLCHCIEETFGGKARILTAKGKVETPKPGTRQGKRLDCWIISDPPNEDHILYQVEIKNWSAHSYGGTYLSTNADSEKIKQHRIRLWGEDWDDSLGPFVEEEARKVVLLIFDSHLIRCAKVGIRTATSPVPEVRFILR